MANLPDPVVLIPPGSLAPDTPIILYKGTEPHVGKRVNEGHTLRDGSVSIVATGVEPGTDVCVVGAPKDGDTKIVVESTAGEPGARAKARKMEFSPSSRFAGMAPPEPDSDLSGEALQDRARELDIPGRSKLSADELREAVADAEQRERV